ncbi:MAG: HEAT repeat domain-containing protein [Blastocatellia bacterium]
MLILQIGNIFSQQDAVQITYYLISFFIISTLLFLIILILHKLYIEKQNKQKENYKKIFIELINNYLIDQNHKIIINNNALAYETFIEVSIDLLLTISGTSQTHIKDLNRKLGVIDFYKKQVDSNIWLKRFQAIEKLGFLKLTEEKEYFLILLEKEEKLDIKQKLLWALSLIADEEILFAITKVLSTLETSSAKFNEYIYFNIIQEFCSKEIEDRFVSFLNKIKMDESIPQILKRDIIEACGSTTFYKSAKQIIEYCFIYQQNPNIKISCIRALGKLMNTQGEKLIKVALSDIDWRVRAVAAQSAEFCSTAIIPDLQKLLADKEYYVRFNACKTLSKLGSEAKEILSQELNSENKLVRDMAHFALKQ